MQLNQRFDVDDFLSNYWQKKPLYIPQLITQFQDPISPEELAGLAMETECESRLVEGNNPDQWVVNQGPFDESRFTSLPADAWTLLVQAVDQWNEPVFNLKQLFRFLPQWRVEDVMVSFAADGSGVGPHFDYYDVFLVQGLGERKWQVGPKCSSKSKIRNCAGLSILEDFQSLDEYVLSPGDALYIPPQFAHWGTSIDRSLCYSIGCRAPSAAEILEGYSDYLIDRCVPEDRYTDPDPARPKQRGEIRIESITPSFNKISKLIDNKDNYTRWFGEFTTRPKYQGLVLAPPTQFDLSSLQEQMNEQATIAINPSSRISFLTLEANAGTLLFVDGNTIELSPCLGWYAPLLCKAPEISNTDMFQISSHPEAMEQTLNLLNQGSLILY